MKLSASPAFEVPDLSGIVDGASAGSPEHARLETTYFDTQDLRLARWGLTLSFAGSEWTLELPEVSAAAGGRPGGREITIPGSLRRPPDQVMSLIRAYLRGTPLEPVARLSTRCTRVPLLDAAGDRLAGVVDEEVSVLHGRRVAARFREVEIEIEVGGDEVLEPLLARLRQAGAGSVDQTPRFVRALGPAALDQPDVAVHELVPAATTADVIRHALAASVQLVLRHDPLVRVGGDPEDVHQVRVGTRRLRSHLWTFRPLLDREWTASLRAELGWLARELGAVRDREVLLERVRGLVASLPPADTRPAAGLLDMLAASIAGARSHLLEAMSSRRYYDLMDRLAAAAAAPALDETQAERTQGPPARVLPALALRPWRDLRRAVSKVPDPPTDDSLHQVRIVAKRVRYACEAVAPALGVDAVRFGRTAAALQTELGEHQDSITAQAWLRGLVTSPRRAFVAGELCAMEAARTDKARVRWPAAWARLNRPKARAWMTATPD